MAQRPRIAIVGCGRTGGSIGLALERAGYPIAAVWSRSRAGRERASGLLEAPVLADAADAVHAANVAIVSIPDDAIADFAPELVPGIDAGQLVVHTSGAMSVETLAPVRDAGGRIGGVHPLQTLPGPERGAEALKGAPVAVTCADEDRQALHQIASGWGGVPFPLPDEGRLLYHAGAVFASNYVTAALWAATDLFDRAGVPNPGALLGPLVRAAVDNVIELGASRAVTGPVIREDTEVLSRHVEALRGLADAEEILDGYRALAMLTARAAGVDLDRIAEAVA